MHKTIDYIKQQARGNATCAENENGLQIVFSYISIDLWISDRSVTLGH